MKEITTIQLDKKVVRALKRVKRYPRETYNDLIMDLIKAAKPDDAEENDRFMREIQKKKMKELWGEGDYSAWERA